MMLAARCELSYARVLARLDRTKAVALAHRSFATVAEFAFRFHRDWPAPSLHVKSEGVLLAAFAAGACLRVGLNHALKVIADTLIAQDKRAGTLARGYDDRSTIETMIASLPGLSTATTITGHNCLVSENSSARTSLGYAIAMSYLDQLAAGRWEGFRPTSKGCLPTVNDLELEIVVRHDVLEPIMADWALLQAAQGIEFDDDFTRADFSTAFFRKTQVLRQGLPPDTR